MSALEESEQLLAQIASHTRRNTSTTSEYAQAIDTLASTVSDQDKDLSRYVTSTPNRAKPPHQTSTPNFRWTAELMNHLAALVHGVEPSLVLRP